MIYVVYLSDIYYNISGTRRDVPCYITFCYITYITRYITYVTVI